MHGDTLTLSLYGASGKDCALYDVRALTLYGAYVWYTGLACLHVVTSIITQSHHAFTITGKVDSWYPLCTPLCTVFCFDEVLNIVHYIRY